MSSENKWVEVSRAEFQDFVDLYGNKLDVDWCRGIRTYLYYFKTAARQHRQNQVRSAPPARVAEFHYGQEPKKCYIIDYVYEIYQEYKKENGA